MSTDGTGKTSARNLYRHNSFTSRASMPELHGRRYLHFRTSSEPISPLSICFCDTEREREREREEGSPGGAKVLDSQHSFLKESIRSGL